MAYEARWSRPVHLGLAAATLALSVLGFAAAGIIPTGSEPQPAVGWAIVAGCVAAAGLFLLRAFSQAPQARADQHGIWTRRLGQPVAWRDISRVSAIRTGIQQIVRIETSGTRGAFGINTTFYDRGMRQLLAAVREFRPDLAV